jgi:hypothetical protein
MQIFFVTFLVLAKKLAKEIPGLHGIVMINYIIPKSGFYHSCQDVSFQARMPGCILPCQDVFPL